MKDSFLHALLIASSFGALHCTVTKPDAERSAGKGSRIANPSAELANTRAPTPAAPSAAAAAQSSGAEASAGTAGASQKLLAPASSVTAVPVDGPRVYAKSRFIWIRPEPNSKTEWIGFLSTGGSVRLKSETPVAGPGCSTWYPVEPQGYVCVDGKRATIDANDPVYRAIKPYAPNTESPTPHRYGESTGLKRLEFLADSPLVFPDLPHTIRDSRSKLRRTSTVAYTAEVNAGGKDWLLTADYAFVPKERVVPYPEVTFKGVHLGGEVTLPIAFFKRDERPKYKKAEDGSFQATSEVFARLSFVSLEPEAHEYEGEDFYKLRGQDIYVKAREAVIPKPWTKTPWGAPVGGKDETGITPKGRATWLEVAVVPGWLIAYEGTKPVYATLISPGRGGPAKKGEDPIETASTPTGIFPISGKFVTATMVAPGELVHSDVPWAQNFSGPHALHGAYWHNDWGKWKSGGCINVSPIDGKWLYEFTDPPAPTGWHGTRWLPWQGPATTLVVHR